MSGDTALTPQSAPGARPGGRPVVSCAGRPRWLDDKQQVAWRQLVSLLHGLPAALDRQAYQDAGIPHAHYLILAMLSEAPDRALRMTELAQRTSSSLSRLSHAVARLQEHGWVERRRCPTDRRGQIAALTDAGLARVVELAPGHVEAVQRYVFDVLSAEQVGHLRSICEAVTTAIADDERRAAEH